MFCSPSAAELRGVMSGAQSGIVVGLSGGLGNQMFQYATGRALSLRLNVPLALDLSWFAGRQDRTYALAPFAISATLIGCVDDSVHWQGRWMKLVDRVVRRLAPRRRGVPVCREKFFHFDSSVLELSAPVCLDGYWQSERYFSDAREVIAADFVLKYPMEGVSRNMLERICASDAICVHVRRGDYVTNPVAGAVHGLCQLDYYQQGVQSVIDGMAAPHCFVFSDDPEWVRANLHLPVPTTIVDFNAGNMAHEDLRLMAACKRFVIANSSFSWWGAWLCADPDKRVVAPRKWFQDELKDTRDLIPESWARL